MCFNDTFRKDALLHYLDLSKPTFLFIDAHITGFGAILAQGNNVNDTKPVALDSSTTSLAEIKCPQLDLEAMGLDFALQRFRLYIVGALTSITIVTDHKPLCSVFNGTCLGSIQTEHIK